MRNRDWLRAHLRLRDDSIIATKDVHPEHDACLIPCSPDHINAMFDPFARNTKYCPILKIRRRGQFEPSPADRKIDYSAFSED